MENNLCITTYCNNTFSAGYRMNKKQKKKRIKIYGVYIGIIGLIWMAVSSYTKMNLIIYWSVLAILIIAFYLICKKITKNPELR